MQHEAQQMLLGRTGHLVMAACLLKSLIEYMGHHTYAVQTVDCGDEALHVALDGWRRISQQLQLPDATTCAVDMLPDHLITEAQNACTMRECTNVLHGFLPGDLVHVLKPWVFP